MNTRIRVGSTPFAIGIVTGLLPQLAGGWWLNSSRGVVTTMAVLFVTAIGVCGRSDTPWFRAAAMAIGALAGMTAALFWKGPGTPAQLFTPVQGSRASSGIAGSVIGRGGFPLAAAAR